MSHLTHIKTTIKNSVVLEQVLKEMISDELDGILTKAYLEYNSAIQDPFGNSKIAEFVVRRKQNFQGGYDFGFKIIEKGEFEFLTRDGSKYDAQIFMQKLIPWYARENMLYSLRLLGFEIESQIEENGQVKIVAGKWE